MVKKTALLLMVFCVLGLASYTSALQVDSPGQFSIKHLRDTMEITVFNDSSEEKNLQIFFFAPMRYTISAPKSIPAHSEETILIRIYNYPPLYNTVYSAQSQILLGNKNIIRKTSLSFFVPVEETPTPEPEPEPQPEPAPQPNPITSGLIVFFSQPITDLALQILFGLVIVIVCIALVARAYAHFKGE